MKQTILMLSGSVIAVLVFFILFSLQQREIRQTKLDNARTEIMKEYMDSAFWNFDFKNQTDEEFVSYFEAAIKERISEEGEFHVFLYARDMAEGILSLKVTEEYSHLNGQKGKLESMGVVVLEEEEDI